MALEAVTTSRYSGADPVAVASWEDFALQDAIAAPRYNDNGEPIARSSWIAGQSSGNGIVIAHNIKNGNIDPASVVITNGSTDTPSIAFDTLQSIFPLWRHFAFSITGAEGKTPTFAINRSTKDGSTYIHADYRPVYTTDFITWTQADVVNLVGDVSGAIEFSFAAPLPAGTVYIASSPYWRTDDAVSFASLLLSTHSSVASPTTSADANGVYATTPSVNNAFGSESGLNNQYAIKLDWGGATADSFRKRSLVVIAGIHGAGSANSDIAFRESILWMLNDSSQEAQDFRSNFEVYCYFLVNPDGHSAGEAKLTPDSSVDPNRAWNVAGDSALPIITDLQNAIIADTGGSADVFLSWHGSAYSTDDFRMSLISSDVNPQTRSPAIQEIIDQGLIHFSAIPDVNNVTATNSDIYWANTRLGSESVGVGVALAAKTTIAHYQDLAAKWMAVLSASTQETVFIQENLSGAGDTQTHISGSGSIQLAGFNLTGTGDTQTHISGSGSISLVGDPIITAAVVIKMGLAKPLIGMTL